MKKFNDDGNGKLARLRKVFDRGLWGLAAGFFAILMIIAFVGGSFANKYSANINTIFNVETQKKVTVEEEGQDSEYYKSDYYLADGSYDNQAMRNNSLKVAEQAASEGTVLLWNNGALPLAKDSKVSLFGAATQKYIIAGGGSGYVGINTTATLKSELESRDIEVNSKLWNAYKLLIGNYGYQVLDVKDEVGDQNYWEYRIREIPWTTLESTSAGTVTDGISAYGDAAVMVITRYTSEDGDTDFTDPECLDDNYLDLSEEEYNVLNKLSELKKAGDIGSIVLLINTANPIQMKHISEMDIDACAWVGMGGSASYAQVANLLSGAVTPSGHLVDTFAYDNDSAPAVENFGDYTFTQTGNVPADDAMTHNTKYLVYQEGVYVGYRYYETRYEDYVAGNGNAGSGKGVCAGEGSWNYSDEVAFTFGYGLSYTDFEYSDFSVTPEDGNFKVSLKITNSGDTYSGKEVLQVYLQKPYTGYDRENGIEKPAVELAGFAKTKDLAPGDSQTLTVTVKGEDFKTYDSYNKGTYILEKGDYYLAVGTDAHDALNNILAAKGFSPENTSGRMDDSGNADFAFRVSVEEDDFETYSVSSVTGAQIKNRFDNADVNLYEGTADQKITYLSRSDWDGTYPSAVEMKCVSERMVKDMQYGAEVAVKDGDEMPVYGTVTAEEGELALSMLSGLDFNDELWQDLLNQLTWEQQNMLLTYGYCRIVGISEIGSPECKAGDGPAGIKGELAAGLNSLMCFPSQQLLASTFDVSLVNEVGKAFGLEMLHSGYTGIYGPGAGIHRTAYSGRNFEYYSEDGFLSGKMFAAETSGLQSKGVIVFAKHLVLNDQERNRYGGTVWANEQSIREIYLKAFEGGVVEGGANGIMTSHNRVGCIWSGGHSGLLTGVLREEWGFTGITITDAAVSTHEITPAAMASAVVAGQDFWMHGGNNKAWDAYKDNATVCLAIREACHRMLYNQLNSNAMNGVTANTRFIDITPSWQIALTAAQAVSVALTVICLLMTIVGFVVSSGMFGKKYLAIQQDKKVKASANMVNMQSNGQFGEGGGSGASGDPGSSDGGEDGGKERKSVAEKWRALSCRRKIIAVAATVLAVALVAVAIILPVTLGSCGGKTEHVCEHVCPVCGKCTDPDCDDPACADKCLGHGAVHICEHTCPICGKCTDYGCDDPVCADKCGGGNPVYTFEAEDERVVLSEGTVTNSDGSQTVSMPSVSKEEGATETYIGNFSCNVGAAITFYVTVEEDTTASLIVSVSKTNRYASLTSIVSVFVNDEMIENRADFIEYEDENDSWIDFVDVNLGCVELKAGQTNVIKLVQVSNERGNNVNAIRLRSAASASLANPPSEYGDESWTSYDFNAADGQGITYSSEIQVNEGGYFGMVSGNAGQYMLWQIDADSAGQAVLYLGASVRAEMYGFSDAFNLTVNGKNVPCDVEMPSGGDNWETFRYVALGKVNLVQGTNIIKLTVISSNGATGCNVQGLRVRSETAVLTAHAGQADMSDGRFWTAYDMPAAEEGAFSENVQVTQGKGGLPAANGDYIGNMAANNGASVTFKVNSSQACVAGLYFDVCCRAGEFAFGDVYKLTVNGNDIGCTADMSCDETVWDEFMSVFLGEVQLIAGENTITVTVISDADLSGNIRGITVSSEATVIAPSGQTEPVDPDPDDDLYIFAAVRNGQLQTGVSVSGGTSGSPNLNGNYLGNIACNVGASVTFTLNSTQACTAKLYFSVCHRLGDFVFDDVYKLTVNGTPVASSAAMPNDDTQWEVFEDVLLGEIELVEGTNTITISVANDLDISGNIQGIIVATADAVISAVDVPDEPDQPVDPDPDEPDPDEPDQPVDPDPDEPDPDVPDVPEAERYEFNAATDGVLAGNVELCEGTKGLPSVNGNYLGNIACNVGASVTFTLNSTQACTAKLYFSVCHRLGDFVFDDVYKLTVNGTPVASSAAMPNDDTQWEVFEDVLLGEIELVEGTNTITISIANDLDISGNIQGISVETADSVISAAVLPEAKRYEFNAATGGVLADNVELGAGTGGLPSVSGDYLGSIATNKGASVTFKVNSAEACTAELYFSVCYRKGEFTFDEVYEITVNGEKAECSADMSYGDTQWELFMEVDIGEVLLSEGENTITVTVITDRDISGNIRGIVLETAGTELS